MNQQLFQPLLRDCVCVCGEAWVQHASDNLQFCYITEFLLAVSLGDWGFLMPFLGQCTNFLVASFSTFPGMYLVPLWVSHSLPFKYIGQNLISLNWDQHLKQLHLKQSSLIVFNKCTLCRVFKKSELWFRWSKVYP